MGRLGVLNERDARGYEIKQLARAADLAHWAEIGYGSIYHALQRLEDEGLIEEVGIEQEGGYPQRTVYRITEAGRDAFRELLRDACRTVVEPKYPIDLAVVFLGKLAPEEMVALLRERLQQLEQAQEAIWRKRDALKGAGSRLASLRAVLDHDLMLRDAEIRWMRRLVDEVADWPAEVGPGIGHSP
ncbi:MAG: hypothetical protein BAA04_07570 [Firmicutes bacterium ZCTH02-B6]|nr:MAG: hypothetical protein BAA04_07570 [Firmicutes bacterium ZCTH02-B6]